MPSGARTITLQVPNSFISAACTAYADMKKAILAATAVTAPAWNTAYRLTVLAGTGIGIKSTIDRKIYTSLTLGIPLMRDINGDEVDKTRIHFMLNGQF